MQIKKMLEDGTPVGKILGNILNFDALKAFNFDKRKMGFSNERLRTGFMLAMEIFLDSTERPKETESRELVKLGVGGVPPSISPLAIYPVFGISTKLKYKLHKALSRGSADVANTVHLEMLLDSISYGCHLVSDNLEMSYRDHYVHPVAVAASGVHILLHGSKPPLQCITELLWNSPNGKRLLEACAPEAISQLDEDLRADVDDGDTRELRRASFVLLAWIITAVYHDIGRHLITMAQLQALNSYEKSARVLPVFHSYVSRSCFSRKSKVLKVCSRSYPHEEYLRPFLEFAERVCPSASKMVRDRLRGKLGASIKGLGREDHPDDVDHAFLSSLELFTWSKIIEKDLARKVTAQRNGLLSRVTALRLASASILIHHLGSTKDTKEALFKITAFDKNPLGVLLRVVDFFHSSCRPFMVKYDPDVSGDEVLYHNIQVDLYDTADHITLKLNGSSDPLPFTFYIKSRLREALTRAADHSFKYKKDKYGENKFVTKQVKKFENEKKTLDKWLEALGTGIKLDVRR